MEKKDIIVIIGIIIGAVFVMFALGFSLTMGIEIAERIL